MKFLKNSLSNHLKNANKLTSPGFYLCQSSKLNSVERKLILSIKQNIAEKKKQERNKLVDTNTQASGSALSPASVDHHDSNDAVSSKHLVALLLG